MKTTAFCCVALLAAACGFEGSEGYIQDDPVSAGPPVDPLPVGTLEVSGSVVPVTQLPLGEYYAALLPLGTQLPATNPCLPKNARSTWISASGDLSFKFKDVAPGQYELAVLHFDLQRYHLERTLKTITVGTSNVALGAISLPAPLNAQVREGGGFGPGGEDDRVMWSAPAGFTTSAFNITLGAYLCNTGPALTVRGAYEVTAKDIGNMKVVVESPDAKQMAIHTVDVD